LDKSSDTQATVIIPAAGSGTRMGGTNKLLLPLAGRPLLLRTIEAFEACPLVSAIVLAVSPDTAGFYEREIKDNPAFAKVLAPVPGGATRQDSVSNALREIADRAAIILVHDGARPLVSNSIIESVIKRAAITGAALPVVPLKDTIKEVKDDLIIRTVPRETLRAVQTPQGFSADLLKRAFTEAAASGLSGTDEASLVEAIGVRVSTVPGSYENIKITTPEDMLIAESFLSKNRG